MEKIVCNEEGRIGKHPNPPVQKAINVRVAMRYLRKGYSVIPVRQDKKPYVRWAEYQTKKPTVAQIREWWRQWPQAEIGIITGSVSGILVVDVDSEKGHEALSEYLPEEMVAPVSRTPSGGWHYFFKHTEGIGNATRFIEDCDIRGEGGYVIVPPSRGMNGVHYTWAKGLRIHDVEPAPLPRALADIIEGRSSKGKDFKSQDGGNFEELPRTSGDFKEGTRDNLLFDLARFLAKGGADESTIEKYCRFVASHCEPPFPEEEVFIKINSALKYFPNRLQEPLYLPTVTELEELELERPQILIEPWLREGETNILYSDAGVGKSLLAILVACLLSNRKYRKNEVGGWQVKKPVGTLYIDGELGEAEMLDRVHQFDWMGKRIAGIELRILSLPEHRKRTEQDFDLSKREYQQQIADFFRENPEYRLVVIDSVSTVFNLENENDNSEWNRKVVPFIRDMRALGVAQIIQHHSGKNEQLRGASAMKAMAANVLKLKNDPRKEKGQAWFTIDNAEKQRAAGKGFEPFTIKFIKNETSTKWEITDGGPKRRDSKKASIMMELLRGHKNKEVAAKYEVSRGYVSQIKREAKEEGLLDSRGNLIERGSKFLEEYGDDDQRELGL
ncbi:bifunctional DNA primase/polymerase [Thermodesulfobacteriota bacterium]